MHNYLYDLRSFNPDILNDSKAEILIAIAERLERIAELMEHSDEYKRKAEAQEEYNRQLDLQAKQAFR